MTLLAASVAPAEHLIPYRFVVLGYVLDAAGGPVAGQAVELVRDKTGFSYVDETDPRGLFVLIARLSDESLGEPLTLRVGARSTRITARFDPDNHVEERGTRVDLVGAGFVERAASFRSTLARFLAEPAR